VDPVSRQRSDGLVLSMPAWSRRCRGGIDAASFGVSGQLFGIHRYRSESELGFASDRTRRKNRRTQIVIAVVIASVASLFVSVLPSIGKVGLPDSCLHFVVNPSEA